MHFDEIARGQLLIIDSRETDARILWEILSQAGYTNIRTAAGLRAAIDMVQNGFQPDLVILDLEALNAESLGPLRDLQRRISQDSYVPLLAVVTGADFGLKERALLLLARDYITRPFDRTEVLFRVKNLLETRLLYLQVQHQNQVLEERVRQRTRELEAARLEILERLALAAEYRDDATGKHTRRVARISALVGRELGLPSGSVRLLERAAPLHDIGKIAVPDRILLKPGPLTPEEFEVVKAHTVIGARILSGSRFDILRLAEQIALSHHERWDGNGYPQGLSRDQIPVPGRIVAVADVFDALTHARPYKPPWPWDEAVAEIENQRGRQFDPRVVDAFLNLATRGELRSALADIEDGEPQLPAQPFGLTG
jgi:putative two-component system response regulator